MERRITATELARGLSEVLSRVSLRGEEFVIERHGRAIAVLAPIKPKDASTLSEIVGALKGLKLPGDGFADDLEAIQASQPQVGPSPWES